MSQGYTRIAIILHWLIAAAIVFQVVLGWRMSETNSASTYAVFQLHKSIGITILVLSLVRLAWRITHRAPSHPDSMNKAEKLASGLVHLAFYGIMIGLPISGWLIVSAARIDIPTLLYATVPWPHIPFIHGLPTDSKEAWELWSSRAHELLAWLTYGLLALHIGAVVKHQWLDREPTLARMAGGGKAGLGEPRIYIALVGLLAVGLAGWFYTPSVKKADVPVSIEKQYEEAEVLEPAPEATAEATIAEESAPEPEPETSPEPQPLSTWLVNSSGASLGFTTSWSGEAVNGQFGSWDAKIVFSPDMLERSSIEVTIDTRSAATGDAQRDSSLPSEDFFNSTSHPAATFTSNRIRQIGGERYVAEGTLSLRGISRPLSLPFRLKINGDTATASGSTALDRTIFGVGQGMYADTESIPANVRVNFSFTARRTR